MIDCLQRARAAGAVWPLPEAITDEILETRLYPAATAIAAMSIRRPQPDWAAVHRELRRPGVTLQLLWRSIARRIPTATVIAATASSIAPGKHGCRRPCDRATSPASACSSITPARHSK